MHGFGGAELNRLLVEHSLGLMCVHDLDGILLAVNPAVSQSLGYPVGEGVGRSLKTFLAPAVAPLFDEYLARIRAHGSDSGLMRLVARDGSERVWLYRNVRYDEPGAPSRVLGHALDITSRMETERELKEARKELTKSRDELAMRVAERTAELQVANERLRAEIARRERLEEELLRARYLESLGMLAGGIAHDFNNFLTVVQGNLAMAKTALRADDPAVDFLDETSRACQRVAALGQQLLSFAKGGAPIRRTVALGRLVAEAAELARAGSNASVDLAIAPDLWAAEIDPAQISQALYNLLVNARRAVPRGGRIELVVENFHHPGGEIALPEGRYIRITVRDFGAGMPPESLTHIFDPYFSTERTGSGLGLTSAYAIASRHGGTITVQSQPGSGSTFCLHLPASNREPAPEPTKAEELHHGSGRILVMDDEEPIRLLLARLLGRLGYEAETASEGGEAVAMYESARASGKPFAAVLVDLTVAGGMGGKETAAALRTIDPGVKIVVSSGYSDDAVMSDFRSYGFADFVPKPWTPAQLSEVLRRVLV